MCRNIRPLFNYDPPVTSADIRAASLQFVRKISGYTSPSKANENIFFEAVDQIAQTSEKLLSALTTTTPPRNREDEILKARARAQKRFGKT